MKTTTRRNTDGTAVRYLHLAHNEWDPTAGRSVPKILHSFGREDHLDRAALTRLVASLSKLLDPADALTATAGLRPRAHARQRRTVPRASPTRQPTSRRSLHQSPRQVVPGMDAAPLRGRPPYTITQSAYASMLSNGWHRLTATVTATAADSHTLQNTETASPLPIVVGADASLSSHD